MSDPLRSKVLDESATQAALARDKEDYRDLPPWAEMMANWLDDRFRIPGTQIRFGLDALVGLVPVLGDGVSSFGSIALLALAVQQKVPTLIILRMVMNIGLDVVLGSLPFIGDIFDIGWRSNRRNKDLIDKYRGGGDPGAVDYLVVGAGVVFAIAAFVLPLIVMLGLGSGIAVWLNSLLKS